MGRKPKPPADAAARVDLLVANTETLWELKVAGWRALDPTLTLAEVRAIALATTLGNSAWPAGRRRP